MRWECSTIMKLVYVQADVLDSMRIMRFIMN